MTVSEFFRRFTSEDNASFEALQRKAQRAHREKFHWMHEALDAQERMLLTATDTHAHTDRERDTRRAGMLMLYYLGDKVLSAEERARVDEILRGETSVGDDRKNGVDAWAFRVRNQLMFYPELRDSRETCRAQPVDPTRSSALPVTSMLLLTAAGEEERAGRTKTDKNDDGFLVPTRPSSKFPRRSLSEKRIQRESTNLPGADLVHAVDAYLRGSTSHFMASPLEAPHTPSTIATQLSVNAADRLACAGLTYDRDEEEEAALRGGRKRSYDKVEMSPAPVPGVGVLASPLMTWGHIAATPLVLGRSNDEREAERGAKAARRQALEAENAANAAQHEAWLRETGPKFHINTLSDREQLARSLEAKFKSKAQALQHNTDKSVEREQKKLTSTRESILNTPIFAAKKSSSSAREERRSGTSSMRKIEHLTPAAQALVKKLQYNSARK